MRAGIRLEPEVSFQGGDGYLFFGSPELALATLTRFAEAAAVGRRPSRARPIRSTAAPTSASISTAPSAACSTTTSQVRTYSRAITAFGLGLLNDTGSRKSRRQSDLAADRDDEPAADPRDPAQRRSSSSSAIR